MKALLARLSLSALLVGAWLFGASPGRAQEDLLSDPRLAEVHAPLREIVVAARREGLPEAWLRDKIAEGLSKRVPPARIVAAVRGLLVRMREADLVLREVPGAVGSGRRALLRAGVDALAAGAPPRGTTALVRRIVERDRAHAVRSVRLGLRAVSELGERGFAGDAALEAVGAAYERDGDGGVDRLLEDARRLPAGDGATRDAALREAGRRGVDPGGGRGDHVRHGDRGGGRPPR